MPGFDGRAKSRGVGIEAHLDIRPPQFWVQRPQLHPVCVEVRSHVIEALPRTHNVPTPRHVDGDTSLRLRLPNGSAEGGDLPGVGETITLGLKVADSYFVEAANGGA